MSRRLLVIMVVLTVFAFGLRAWGLGRQVPTNDDLGVALSASNWVLHGQPEPTEPFHPRLRDFLVYVSLAVFGPTAAGLKGWSVILGSLCVPLLFALVWRLSRNGAAASLAALLLAVDGVHLGYSRQAVQEVHVAFFTLLATLLVVDAIVGGPSRRWRWLLPGAGIAFGLAMASKYYAVPALLVSIAVLLVWAIRRKATDEYLLVIASLVIIPATVFLATYAPWFERGYSFVDWIVYQRALVEAMVTHTRETAFVRFSEPAAWFLTPFTGFADFAVSPDGSPHLSVATGNPLVWLLVLPATAYSLIAKRHRKSHQLLQAYLWASYLPLALSTRPVWVLSSVVVIVFAIALLSLVVVDVAKRWRFGLVPAYATVVLVTSLALYPLATGRALDHPYLRPVVDRMGGMSSFTTIPEPRR